MLTDHVAGPFAPRLSCDALAAATSNSRHFSDFISDKKRRAHAFYWRGEKAEPLVEKVCQGSAAPSGDACGAGQGLEFRGLGNRSGRQKWLDRKKRHTTSVRTGLQQRLRLARGSRCDSLIGNASPQQEAISDEMKRLRTTSTYLKDLGSIECVPGFRHIVWALHTEHPHRHPGGLKCGPPIFGFGRRTKVSGYRCSDF